MADTNACLADTSPRQFPTGWGLTSGGRERVRALKRDGSPDIFVTRSPDVSVDHPSGEVYRFWGGHRLRVSPEVPAVTYAPDNHGCVVTSDTDNVTSSAPSEVAGFEKSLHLSLDEEANGVEESLI